MWVGGSQIDPELGRPAATSLAGAGSAGAGKDGKIPVRACWSDPTQGIPSVSQRENIGLSCKQETPITLLRQGRCGGKVEMPSTGYNGGL